MGGYYWKGFTEILWEDVNWIGKARDMHNGRAAVKAVMHIWVPQSAVDLLNNWGNISLSKELCSMKLVGWLVGWLVIEFEDSLLCSQQPATCPSPEQGAARRTANTRIAERSSGHSSIAVLNSGRTAGWRSICDKLQITRSCSCWPESVTTWHAGRKDLFYAFPCVTASHRVQFQQYFVGHRRTSTILQRNLVQRIVQVRIHTFCVLQEGRRTLLQGVQHNHSLNKPSVEGCCLLRFDAV
jgi:hypothetical protein